MSLKGKSKTLVKGEISIICANCDLDRSKEKTPLTTHCPRCGFNPAFPNKIVQRLEDCEKEFARQLEFLVNKQCGEWKQKLQQLIDVLKQRPSEKGASYSTYQEGWLDGMALAIQKFEELLKE